MKTREQELEELHAVALAFIAQIKHACEDAANSHMRMYDATGDVQELGKVQAFDDVMMAIITYNPKRIHNYED